MMDGVLIDGQGWLTIDATPAGRPIKLAGPIPHGPVQGVGSG